MSYYYKYFDLVFKVEFPLVGEETSERDYDVEVSLGEVPKAIKAGSKYKHNYILQGDEIYLDFSRLAYYYISAGNKVIIEPIGDLKMEGIVTYFYGPCLSILLIQRGWIPLHGSAVFYDNKTYLIVGHSGAGKSSFSAGLVKEGGKIISDDIILVKWKGDGFYTMKGSATQKLWKDTIESLNLEDESLIPLVTGKDKYYLVGNESNDMSSYHVDAMIAVEKTRDEDVSLTPLSGRACLERYITYTFWRGLINEVIGETEFFNHAVELTNKLPVFCMKRPSHKFTVDQQITLFLSEIHC